MRNLKGGKFGYIMIRRFTDNRPLLIVVSESVEIKFENLIYLRILKLPFKVDFSTVPKLKLSPHLPVECKKSGANCLNAVIPAIRPMKRIDTNATAGRYFSSF